MEDDKLPMVAATANSVYPDVFMEFNKPVWVYGRYGLDVQPSLG